MKIRTLLTITALSLAGLGVSPESAQAVLTQQDGDLFIGFRAIDPNTGSATSYAVNIGSYTNYEINDGTFVISGLGNTSGDLASIYGENWYSDPNVSWGVVGIYADSLNPEVLSPTLYSSRARVNPGTPATGFALLNSNSKQIGVGSTVQTFVGYYANSGSPTSNSTVATFQTASNPSSYAAFTSTTVDFNTGGFSNWQGIEGTAPGNSTLDLFQYSRSGSPVAPLGAVTRTGSFTIDSAGAITFNAVPEPATLALIGLGLGGVMFLRRRRRSLPLTANGLVSPSESPNTKPRQTMKSHKSLAALLAVLTVPVAIGAASAQQNIFIGGSNGDRASTNTAVFNLLATSGNVTFAGTNADITKANFGVFRGKWPNAGNSSVNTTVDVYVSFIGATGGIKALAGNQTIKFVNSTIAGTNNGTIADPTGAGNSNQLQVPSFSTSTNFQATSPYIGLYQNVTYITLDDQLVAAIPLKWLGSKTYPGDNLTTQLAQLLQTTGRVPYALFSGGNATDENKTVFATGRNSDAGQRYLALGESGLGVDQITKFYKPSITGASAGVGGFVTGGTVANHTLWPVETVSGVSSQFPGNSGASSGANLAPFLTANLTATAYKVGNAAATAGWYISYLTVGDSDTIAIPNGAVELKWNGVPYSADNIRRGKYTFWAYQHVLTKPEPGPIFSLAKQFADALAQRLLTVDGAVVGILIDDPEVFRVSRQSDGGLVTADYF